MNWCLESLAPSRLHLSTPLPRSLISGTYETRRVESNFVAPFIWHRQVFNTFRVLREENTKVKKNNNPKK